MPFCPLPRQNRGFFVAFDVRTKNVDINDVDIRFMAHALKLAEQGRGTTRPNPMVGAVIVKGGKIIAEGYHRRAGADHAEVVALKKAGRRARGATVYVTLEPCCHTGSTGPCCEALIAAGIRKVVIPSLDPNPIVNGSGAKRLKAAGIEVVKGILSNEAAALNDAYFGRHRNKRPYVILKSAQTLDGRIASVTGDSKWITGKPARALGHRLRSEVEAVLVGASTVRTDNPSLTVRDFKGIDPYRVIVTASGKIPQSCHLIKDNRDYKTVVAAPPNVVAKLARQRWAKHLIFWSVTTTRKGQIDIAELMRCAADFGLTSMLVEGGGKLAASFLKAKIVDKQVVFIAPLVLGSGVTPVDDLGFKKITQAVKLADMKVERVGGDIMVTGYPQYAGKRDK